MTTYELVQSGDINSFNRQITEKLKWGWKLYGNLVVTFNEHGGTTRYIQGMTLESDDNA
jgi:hypothetical protein